MKKQSIQSLLNEAQVLVGENRLTDAREIFLRICEQDQSNDIAWMSLGNLHGALGNITKAEKCCRKAIDLNPQLVSAHANLGNALMAQDRFNEAVNSYTKATELQPDLAATWFMLGKAHQSLFLWGEAESSFRKAVELNPAWFDARLMLGKTLQYLGRFREACQQYKTVTDNQPDQVEAHYQLAVSLSSMGLSDKAEARFRRTLELQPNHLSALNNLSVILSTHGQTDEALKFCGQVLAIKPDDINAACIASHTYEVMGDFNKAYEYLKSHIDAGTKHINLAVTFAAISKEINLQDQAITMMEDIINHSPGLTNTDRRTLYFSLGKLCDHTKQYKRAFEHYENGNKLFSTQCTPKSISRPIESSIEIQTADFFFKSPSSSNQSDRPVFIVGMPRSGTSLVEQILSSHPQVFGAGELAEINKISQSLTQRLNSNKPHPGSLNSVNQKLLDDCANQYLNYINNIEGTSLRVIDKMPGNFIHLGLIQLMFPNARVIHCIRDPIDTCLSCYFQDFFHGIDWCYDQTNLAAYYLGYEKLMKHWKQVLTIPIMDISYENLVANQESISRELIEFCGLDWTDECLHFHKTKRLVTTASYDQVRKPIYKKSVSRWKNYEAHIEPLRKALKK